MVDTPPLYIVTIALVAGDAAGNAGACIPFWCAAVIAIAAATLFLGGRPSLAIALAALSISSAATIPVHDLLAPPAGPTSLTRFADDSTITIDGRLVREPEYAEGGRIYIYLGARLAGSTPARLVPARGVVRVTIRGGIKLRVGDYVRATARIRFPRNDGNPGEFDYRDWLLRNGIAATMFVDAARPASSATITLIGHRERFPASQIEAIREHIRGFIDANLTYPQNAEMRALIIGDRGGIDEPLRQRFALTGMAHLLVISGLHLGFVGAAAFFLVRLAMGLFPNLMARGYANKAAAAMAALAATSYAAIAGNHVSTFRALVMVLAYAGAIMLDRSRELLASLALAALVICFAIPGSTADIGFQLSFASVLLILIGMRRFAAWWRTHRIVPAAPGVSQRRAAMVVEAIAGYVAVSFWALIGTAPLTAFHFNQFSLVGLIANAVVVPIMGFGAVVSGLLAAAADFIWPAGGRWILLFAGKLAALGTALAGWFLGWPWAWTRIFTPTMVELAIVYGLIALWLTRPAAARIDAGVSAVRTRVSGEPLARLHRWRPAFGAALAAAAIIDAGYWSWQRWFNPDLRITFLSVGEGDGAVVRFPGGRVMLIDGGGAFTGSFDTGERIVAPYLWSNKIMRVDYVALSHPDRDHFGGLDFVARNFSPSEFWTCGIGSADESYQRLLEAVALSGAKTEICGASDPARIIGGVEVRCLWPGADASESKENNSSLVIRLGYRGVAILFTGDLEAKGERELMAGGADLHAAILKVPHHGSHTSSSEAFVEAVHPAAAVISLGYHNRFHFPALEVVDRYAAIGAAVLRTDEIGAVSARVGRDGVVISTWRGGAVALKPGAGRGQP